MGEVIDVQELMMLGFGGKFCLWAICGGGSVFSVRPKITKKEKDNTPCDQNLDLGCCFLSEMRDWTLFPHIKHCSEDILDCGLDPYQRPQQKQNMQERRQGVEARAHPVFFFSFSSSIATGAIRTNLSLLCSRLPGFLPARS